MNAGTLKRAPDRDPGQAEADRQAATAVLDGAERAAADAERAAEEAERLAATWEKAGGTAREARADRVKAVERQHEVVGKKIGRTTRPDQGAAARQDRIGQAIAATDRLKECLETAGDAYTHESEVCASSVSASEAAVSARAEATQAADAAAAARRRHGAADAAVQATKDERAGEQIERDRLANMSGAEREANAALEALEARRTESHRAALDARNRALA